MSIRLQQISFWLCATFMIWAVSPPIKPASMSRSELESALENGLVGWCEKSRVAAKIATILAGDDAMKGHRQIIQNFCAAHDRGEALFAEPNPH